MDNERKKEISSSGQTVFEKSYLQLEDSIELDLEHLDSGIYFIQVENGLIRKVKKVIKSW